MIHRFNGSGPCDTTAVAVADATVYPHSPLLLPGPCGCVTNSALQPVGGFEELYLCCAFDLETVCDRPTDRPVIARATFVTNMALPLGVFSNGTSIAIRRRRCQVVSPVTEKSGTREASVLEHRRGGGGGGSPMHGSSDHRLFSGGLQPRKSGGEKEVGIRSPTESQVARTLITPSDNQPPPAVGTNSRMKKERKKNEDTNNEFGRH